MSYIPVGGDEKDVVIVGGVVTFICDDMMVYWSWRVTESHTGD